jgi:hypothetical protein
MAYNKGEINQQFKQIWLRFNANVGALWIFSHEIARLAGDWDKELVHKLTEEIAELFGDDPAEVEKDITEFIPSADMLEIEPDFRENASAREVIEAFQSSEFKQRALNWFYENPRKGFQLLDVMNSAFDQPPANGIILRRSALVNLVGFLDLLVQDLYMVYYSSTGAANVDSLIKKAMSGGWKSRLEFFKTLGVDIDLLSNTLDDLIEIAQRRNLIVHKDGVVDRGYLDNVAPCYLQSKGFVAGQRLLVPTTYLQQALETVHFFGAALHQLCWRSWCSGPQKNADDLYVAFIFSALRHERYPLVIQLNNFADHLNLGKDARLVSWVNHAIAMREMGQKAEVQQIIGLLKRSRPYWKIKIAISVLASDTTNTHLLLKHAGERNKLHNISKDWPLFKPLWDQVWFENAFKLEQSLPRRKKRRFR